MTQTVAALCEIYESTITEPLSSVVSVANLRTGGRWFDPPARPIFFPRIYDSHCDRIHSSFTAVRCFDNAYVENKPVTWKEFYADYWLKEHKESMDGLRDITQILLKTALNTKNPQIYDDFFVTG